MGGDGMGGLAAAIFGAMVCMVVVPTLLFGAAGYKLVRGERGWIGAMVGALLGFVGGALAIVFTFYETTGSPPPTLTIHVPADFAHEWVYVVADPQATTDVIWTGQDLPFTSRHGELTAPRSGVVHVRSVAELEDTRILARLGRPGGDGPTNRAASIMNAPASMGSGRIVAYGFADWPGTEPEPPEDAAELGARIAALEAER